MLETSHRRLWDKAFQLMGEFGYMGPFFAGWLAPLLLLGAVMGVLFAIQKQRGLGTERTTYRVHVLLVGIKQEPDSDFHLVIADPATGKTMIAEFPNQSCTLGAKASLRTKMQTARAAIVTACGFAPNSGYHLISGAATIAGVGFFDFFHKQTGHAPNDLELHPVLKFSGSCS